MRVLVLGHNGMLGREVHRHFNAFVIGERFGDPLFFDRVREEAPDVVVNCIGAIPQKSPSAQTYYALNVGLPTELRSALPAEVLLIHPSTDCVFSGRTGPYGPAEQPDPVDVYGRTKALAERVLLGTTNTIVIRSSIIGRGGGLVHWLLSHQDGDVVSGYTNHFWNGLTAGAWALAAEQLITKRRHLVQLGSDRTLSKADLLREVAIAARRDLTVVDVEHPWRVHRGLVSSVDLDLLSLSEQIAEMLRA